MLSDYTLKKFQVSMSVMLNSDQAVFDYYDNSVSVKWHGAISTSYISFSFGVLVYADVRPNRKVLTASCESAGQL